MGFFEWPINQYLLIKNLFPENYTVQSVTKSLSMKRELLIKSDEIIAILPELP